MSLTHDDTQQIATAVADALDSRRYIDEQTHAKHHEFIDELIDSSHKWSAVRERILERALTVVVIAAVLAVSTAVWAYFKLQVG